MTGVEVRAWAVSVYEDGKWLGYLTPSGGATRKKIHAAQFTEARARAVAREISESDAHAYTAEARYPWPRR